MQTNNKATDQKVDSQQLKELLSKITQGEWKTVNIGEKQRIRQSTKAICDCYSFGEGISVKELKSNATLISLAPTLAKEVIQLREENEKIKKYWHDAQEQGGYLTKALGEYEKENEKLSNENRVLREYLEAIIIGVEKAKSEISAAWGRYNLSDLSAAKAALNNTNK